MNITVMESAVACIAPVYSSEKAFAGKTFTIIQPDPKDVECFGKFINQYTAGLEIERTAVENFIRPGI